jgi:16S rRNA (uracil1498-N3)-methyltransferase
VPDRPGIHWFYADPTSWESDRVILNETESHHATKVLRIAQGDVVTVTDGMGAEALCVVAEVSGRRVVATIIERETRRRPKPEVAVYQGAPKGRKADDVIERLSELGVAEVLVFEGSRSVVRWDDERAGRLAERWRAIARSAAKQSRSALVTHTGEVLGWEELVARVEAEPACAVLWEEATLPLRTALVEDVERLALVVGPEGGLDRSEAEQLADTGAQLVSLGPQILRTENAPVVAASSVLFHYGVIG